MQYLAEQHDAERRAAIIQREYPRGIRSAALKKLVKVPLYDYQAEGALFAAKTGRCLIGDEMGLGKTIQAVAAAEIMARHFGAERVLILCPTSLKHQWQREIERFVDRTVQVVNGLRPARAEQFREPSFFKILNYDTVHVDLDLIERWSPDLVILDEAQRIKNWTTRVARSVKRISTPYAIVLTGTPLENRLEELVSIVQFVDRHRLGPTFQLLDKHQTRDEAGKVVGYTKLDEIGRTLEPILLRRRKAAVLDQLPGRIDQNYFVPMTELQMKLHQENKELVSRIVLKWRRHRFLSEADKQKLMIGLQNMRMACDSSYLLDQSTNEGCKADELATVLGEMFENGAGKAVVFSQWLRMHEVIAPVMQEQGWNHVLFHGGVPSGKRQALVDRFRDDPDCRLFLSTDAGGVGLNLQFAHVVVNMDLPWNPAILEQRIGRVHRIGQKQPVQVVNFVAKGTIEEGMLSVLKFKKSLFAGVLDGGENEIFMGGSRFTKFIESVEGATGAIPAAEPSAAATTPETPEPAAPETPAADPWAGLLQTGLAFLETLSSAAQVKPGVSNPLVRHDEKTGEPYLKLPLPQPEVLNQALQGLQGLLALLGKK